MQLFLMYGEAKEKQGSEKQKKLSNGYFPDPSPHAVNSLLNSLDSFGALLRNCTAAIYHYWFH